MQKFLIILSYLLVLTASNIFGQSDSKLIFSEIMFAPLSGQSEFVEVFNTSEIDTIDLSEFKLKYTHTSNTDNIIPHNNGIKLYPNSFAIIFEEDYDFDTGVYNSLIPTDALIIKIDNGSFASGLSNSTDRTLLLINSHGDTVETYTYSANNSNGISDEKIILSKNNSQGNWSNSKYTNGTPGGINSVSPLQFDLELKNIFFDPEIQFAGLSVSLNFTIKNEGTSTVDFFTAEVFNDINFDSTGVEDEEIFFKSFDNMLSGDSINFSTDIILSEERNYLFIIGLNFNKDQNVLNNFSFIEFLPLPKPSKYNDIIINEIMYKPTDDEPEWIEIFNNSTEEIDLVNWSFGDRSSKVKIANDSLILNLGEFIILSEDVSLIDFYKFQFEPIILRLPSLNNNGDDLYIYDQYNNIIDSVKYFSSWGGGSGNSLERIKNNMSSNDSSNWSTSITKNKGTPGQINSVTQKDFDLEIKVIHSNKKFIISQQPAMLSTIITNIGKNDVNNAELYFYNDFNNDSIGTENELVHSINLSIISNNETRLYEFEYNNYLIGMNDIIAKLVFDNDQFLENNIAYTSFMAVEINEVRNDLVINEFMASPFSGEPEWIEIYNRSKKEIDLKNYKIADESDTIIFNRNSTIINPDEYYLIIDDSSFFNKYNIDVKYSVTNFPSLNNSSDKIILLDSLNRVIDSLKYNSNWGIKNEVSLERIDPFDQSDNPNNWAASKNINAATPGKINSVSTKNFDASIDQIIFNPSQPLYGESVSITALMRNIGKKDFTINALLFEDEDLLEKSASINISIGDSTYFTFNYHIDNLESKRNFLVKIDFENDQDTVNNSLSAEITPGYNYNSLIINEIMFTPQNGEPEWVELYNNKEYRISLENFGISDILTNPLNTVIPDSELFIERNSYLVIAKDSSIINYHDRIPSKIYVTLFANLNNSEDGIVIKDAHNNLIDSVRYTPFWPSKTGYSIERISFDQNSNDSVKWSYSTDIEQSTPGRLNSLSQKSYDAAIDNISISPIKPTYGDEVTLSIKIKNVGFLESNNFSIKLLDADCKLINEIFVTSIFVNDSVIINSKAFTIFDITKFIVEINYPADYNYINNQDSITVIPGYRMNDILINEVMFNPESEQAEWIEFINNSDHEINLYSWQVSDYLPSPKSDLITDHEIKIYPGQYFIITNDSIAFNKIYETDALIFQSSFGTLGNSEDGIIIYDYYNEVIDSLIYTSEFGNAKGYSIERLSLSKSTNDLNNWLVSIHINGATPGFANSVSESKSYKRNEVVINEIMYEPGIDNSEFIEFYNNSNEVVELGGWIIENEDGGIFRISNSNYLLQKDSYFITSADSSIFQFYSLNENESNINIINKSGLGLTNGGKSLLLKDIKGNIIDSVFYSSGWHNPNILETKNQSLERLNPKFSSNESSNWSSSVNILGASPGKRNSVYIDYKESLSTLSIMPNPFSPDNDGFEDFCIINYNLDIPISQLRVKIFDDKGRLVRTLANNQASGSNGSIIFDGLNDNNLPLRIGMYIILFEATNSKTGQQKILKDVVVIARKL